MHEFPHTSLDATHARAADRRAAQTADATFISTYARDFPAREDVAESLLAYLAIRYGPDRISDAVRASIEATIANRIPYFDSLALDLHPIA